MRYFKRINENEEITALYAYYNEVNMTDPLMIEITKEEYETLLEEITKEPEPSEDDEISGNEFLNMVEEVI